MFKRLILQYIIIWETWWKNPQPDGTRKIFGPFEDGIKAIKIEKWHKEYVQMVH